MDDSADYLRIQEIINLPSLTLPMDLVNGKVANFMDFYDCNII